MKTFVLWTLVLVNAIFAGAFVFRLFPDNAAHAQAAIARRPGDYLLIPGQLSGGSTAVVYVLDVTTGKLSAISYDEPRNEIAMMREIDLARVFAAGATIGGGDRRKNR
jgi:hypothetical protein